MQFETRLGTMVEREYLTCKVFYGTSGMTLLKFQSKGGVTGQSMEISPNYTGYFDGENMIFETFVSMVLLGDDVTPAMKKHSRN